jgi:hypothetical protein
MANVLEKSFQLTREELAFILTWLKMSPIPGIESAYTLNPDEGINHLLLDAAGRSLLAHQILNFSANSQLYLDPWPTAILKSCSIPDISLTIGYGTKNSNADFRITHYYKSQDMIFFHQSPMEGIHQFIECEQTDMGYEKIKLLLNKHLSENSVKSITLKKVDLDGIHEAINHNENQKGRDILISFGVSPEISDQVVETVKDPDTRLIMSAIRDVPAPSFQETYSFLFKNNQCWLLENSTNNGEDIILTGVSTSDINTKLEEFFKALT